MKGSELFEIWAPAASPWSRWAKPVLFAEEPLPSQELPATLAESAASVPEELPSFAVSRDSAIAVVVDLPGPAAVRAGLLLAHQGYRPVPLFNGASYPGALIDSRRILSRLYDTAGELPALLPPDAPPAFLLDADRLAPSRPPEPGKYDNRWIVFPQDFPSASLLASCGIRRVLLVQRGPQPQEDLAHVLLRWREAGLELFLQDPWTGASPTPLTVAKPSRFRALTYRALALVGLRRNSAGGFGSIIPVAAASAG